MDPLNHPYSKKHSLKNTNQLLSHINDKLKPKTKYSYYTYNKYPERIIEALNECQEYESLMNLPVEETTQVSRDDRLAKQRDDVIECLMRHGFYVNTDMFNKHPERYIKAAKELKELEAEQELEKEAQALMDLPAEEPTQKPHDERLARRELRELMAIPKNFLTAPTWKEYWQQEDKRIEPASDLEEALDAIDEYTEGKRDKPPFADLEWTAGPAGDEDTLELTRETIKTWLQKWLKKTNADRHYIFQYVILDEYGKPKTRNIHLTPDNISKLIELLDTNGISQDNEHFDPYEDEELPIPSWSLIMKFTIFKFQDLYHHDPNEKYKPREYGKLMRKKSTTRGGGFFKWHASLKLPKPILVQLRRYQIRTRGYSKEMLKDSCAVYALKMGGVSEDILAQMRTSRLNDERFLSMVDLRNLCDEFKINVSIRCCDNQSLGHHNNEVLEKVEGHAGPVIKLCYMKDHYFLEEETPFTSANIKECLTDKEFEQHVGMFKHGERWCKDSSKKKLTSYALVQMLWDMELFEPMSLYDLMDTPQLTFKHDVQQDMKLKWNPKYAFKSAKDIKCCESSQPTKNVGWKVLFADFETDTGHNSEVVNGRYTQPHKPYLVCWSNEDGSKEDYFEGENCGEQLLDMVDDNTIIIFHNLKYDLNFIAKYFNTVEHDVARGKVVMTWAGTYLGKHIIVKDSAALIPCKLAAFPKMFNLETGPKEKMPYNYVRYDVYMNGVGEINGCGAREAKPWVDKDYEEFRESLKAADALLPNDRWDVKKYVRFYCQQDVRILREGFNAFRKMILEDKECLGFDVLNSHSASSIAYKAITQNVLLKDDRILATSGVVDQYIRGAIVGGRCMVRDNGVFHTEEPLVDNDAVSLYPSAMSTIDIPLGAPKAFTGPKIPKNDYYICDITIKSVSKHRHFSTMRFEDGVEKVWTDTEVIGKRFRVDKQTLKDWIEFQGITCVVHKGIYWNEGTTPILKDFIRKLFERRKTLQAEKNPLQAVYKIILNSCYGKMIQKPYSSQKVIIPEDKVADFVYKNYNVIAPNDYTIDGSRLHVFEKRKSIRDNFSFALIGVMTLSHSKHIMNEVMCLAEDLDIHIYYQDTDSMHIVKDKMDLLASVYRKKYGRELIGKNLRQFHPDFDSKTLDKVLVDGHKLKEKYGDDNDAIDAALDEIKMTGAIYAKESYFIGKKIYMDVLTTDFGGEDYHIRMKGVSKEAIMDVCNRKFNGDIRALYKHLYNRGKITFDLTAGKPSFELTKDMRILSRAKFERVIGI